MNQSTRGTITLHAAQIAPLRKALFAQLATETIRIGRDLEQADHEHQAQEIQTAHHRATALGALLDTIGWTPRAPDEQTTIDLNTHAWAALTALPPYATLHRESEQEHTRLGRHRPAQDAAARANAAEHTLQAIEEAIATAGIDPAPPDAAR